MAESKLKPSENQNAVARVKPSSSAVVRLGFFFAFVGLVGGLSGGLPRANAAPNVAPSAAPNSLSSSVVVPAMVTTPDSALPAVLTFQAWKSLRTDEARLILERLTLEGQIFAATSADRTPGERQAVVRAGPAAAVATSPVPRSSPRAAVRPRQDNRVEQARMNLEIAQDLTINDYLQIYLSQFKTADVLRDVARRMNPDEVAELLIAYQKTSAHGDLASSSSAGNSRLCSGAAR